MGEISKFSNISEKNKQLEINKLFIITTPKLNIIATNVEIILYFFLDLLFIIGFFLVSAGAFFNIKIIQITQIMVFINILIFTFMHVYVKPTKTNVELIKQIQLFVACNPNAGILIKVNSDVKIIISLNIPKKTHNNEIIINLEITK